jgi:hypothetical protein
LKNILAPLLVLLAACTYSPDEEPFTSLKKPGDPTKALISLNEFDGQSTIELTESVAFSFSITNTTGKIELVEVVFDEHTIYSSFSATGSFMIDDGYFTDGDHKLRIQFRNTSATGSLAEKLGGERFEIWREWNVTIKNTPPPKPVATLSKENGFLKLSWLPYVGKSFEKYVVTYSASGRSEVYTNITDPNQTYLINEDYVGGYEIQYSVAVKTYSHYVESDIVIRKDKVNLTGSYNTADSMVTLKWDKADFEGAFSKYVISEETTLKTVVDNSSDTTITFKASHITFGLPLFYFVEVESKNSISPISNDFQIDQPATSLKLDPLPDVLKFNKTLNGIVGWRYEKGALCYYDQNLKKKSSPLYMSSTSNNSFAAPYTSPYVYFGLGFSGIYQQNWETFNYQYIDLKNFAVKGFSTNTQVISASANQLVSFRYTGYDDAGINKITRTAIYDVVNNTINYDTPSSVTPLISNTGKYIAISHKMYRVNGVSLEFIYDLTNSISYFRDDNDEEFLDVTYPLISVYDTGTGTLKRTLSFPEGCTYVTYDANTQSLLFTGNNKNGIPRVNIETSESSTVNAYTYSYFDLKFVNGYLVDKNGYYGRAWK